jgi:CDP-2,3-bis-(O-geranylgeranyl)-sn-glycerol synthase
MINHPIGYILWFFLPAMVANMAPVIATRFNLTPALNKPLDGHIMWRGQRLFGSHKTIRGIIWGGVAGSITATVQYLGTGWFNSLGNALLIGLLLGLGALLGDAIKSFLKRRWAIQPGSAWIPWDQIDFVIGAYLATIWLKIVSPLDVFTACIIIGTASYAVSFIAFHLHIKAEI